MAAALNPSLREAQSEAWLFGKDQLIQACEANTPVAFETTLGDKTITDIPLEAAKSGPSSPFTTSGSIRWT